MSVQGEEQVSKTVRAYVALGSNLGERVRQLRQAIGLLQAHGAIRIRQISRFYETEPVGLQEASEPQWFMNAVVGIDTEFSARELLNVCLEIESRMGRVRLPEEERLSLPGYQSRVIDLDILLYEHEVLNEPGLQIPHPRLHERTFALLPMVDIAPDWLHPGLGKTVRELYDALNSRQQELAQPIKAPALAH